MPPSFCVDGGICRSIAAARSGRGISTGAAFSTVCSRSGMRKRNACSVSNQQKRIPPSPSTALSNVKETVVSDFGSVMVLQRKSTVTIPAIVEKMQIVRKKAVKKGLSRPESLISTSQAGVSLLMPLRSLPSDSPIHAPESSACSSVLPWLPTSTSSEPVVRC